MQAVKEPPVFNLPNQLTLARLILGVILFGLIEFHLWHWALAVFALAAFTDWLDGYLARKQNLMSALGRNLDPLVDKVVICGAYIYLLQVRESGLLPWMTTVVVARELIITSLRSYLENQGVTFGAEMLGKIKMVLQCAALIVIFLALEYADQEWLRATRDVAVYAMIVATALSGMQYLWRAFLLFRKAHGPRSDG
jgi:CDP-diacylglycerol--glycerol-3-phosphate 3-phosphatidyltransferase